MNTKSFFYLFVILGSFLAISSCIKDDFDEPPVDGEDPNLEANATIAELKALHTIGGITPIDTSWIIEAVVVADDQSGNLYKTIVIEDGTAGIHVSINSTGLYNNFPVGRKVFIKCEGLVIADFAGLIQLGGSAVFDIDGDSDLSGIEASLLNEFVIPGVRNQPVVPTEYTITELNPTLNSMLVQINDVEFDTPGIPLMDGSFSGNTARGIMLEDCNGASLLVRTSTFSTFINEPAPSGKGTFIGVLTSFGTTRQLLIRNIFDLDMEGERCDGSTGGGGGGGGGTVGPCEGEGDGQIDEDFQSQTDFEDVSLSGWCNLATAGTRVWRAVDFEGNLYATVSAFTDTAPAAEAWLITETVDVTTPQFLNFESAQNNYTHDGLSVWISSNYTGDVLAADWTELDARLAEENDSWYEFIPSGDIDLSDYSGNVNIAFRYEGSGTAGQTGGFHLDNILISEEGLGNGGGGGGNGPCEGEGDGEIDEDFSSQVNNEDVSFPGWCNVATQGTRLWRAREFDGNVYVQATAYNDSEPLMSAWLIMETIDATTPKTLNFDSATAFYTHDGLSVWISSDYTGDPLAANWTQLNANFAGSGQDNYEFVSSGAIDLSGFTGDVNIAFRYDGGSSTGETATFQLDNVVISQ